MYKILNKETLNPTVIKMEIEAPYVAKKAQPGQFIILRTDENGERIPLTVADYDREKGTVTIIFQIVGATTEKLGHMNEGDFLADFVGPLGKATHTEGLKKVAVVGGGVGCAIAFPVAKKLHEQGCEVHAIVGFRTKDLVILEKEFRDASSKFVLMSDDGSVGEKGLVTDALKKLLDSGEKYDEVITIGPLIMMKFVCKLTKEYGVKSFWELPKEVIEEREKHFVAEMTPMMIAELIQLSAVYKVIICEGDIDYRAIAPIATNMVHLCNQSTSFDWFNRPDHEDIRTTVAKRMDLSEEEKQLVIHNAYESVAVDELITPAWVIELSIKNIVWNDLTSIDTTATEVAEYFGFTKRGQK